MKKIIDILYIFLALFIVSGQTSCGHGGENSAEDAADSFSVAYFNWRFVDAQRFATEGSQRCLSFAASQVTQEDVDSLRSMAFGAETDVKDVTYKDDSTAEAIVEVKGFLAMDSIGKKPLMVNKKRFTIPLSLTGDKWVVNLKSLPR